MTSEAEIAIAVLRVLATRPNGEATFAALRLEVPKHIQLTAEDQRQSTTRPNEEMWEQRLRNITSHKASPGNVIHEGYAEEIPGGLRLTPPGRVARNQSRLSKLRLVAGLEPLQFGSARRFFVPDEPSIGGRAATLRFDAARIERDAFAKNPNARRRYLCKYRVGSVCAFKKCQSQEQRELSGLSA